MSQKKPRIGRAAVQAVEHAPEATTGTAGVRPTEPVYAFPTKAKCPRCGSANTTRYASRGDTQYRECRVPTCRKHFTVKGTPCT